MIKVKCIDKSRRSFTGVADIYLKVGEIYTVEYEKDKFYKLNGIEFLFEKDRFEILEQKLINHTLELGIPVVDYSEINKFKNKNNIIEPPEQSYSLMLKNDFNTKDDVLLEINKIYDCSEEDIEEAWICLLLKESIEDNIFIKTFEVDFIEKKYGKPECICFEGFIAW